MEYLSIYLRLQFLFKTYTSRPAPTSEFSEPVEAIAVKPHSLLAYFVVFGHILLRVPVEEAQSAPCALDLLAVSPLRRLMPLIVPLSETSHALCLLLLVSVHVFYLTNAYVVLTMWQTLLSAVQIVMYLILLIIL